jgi:K+-sensing histidine kinase KdpD
VILHPRLRAAAIVLASVVAATLLTFPISNIAVHNRSLLFIAAVIVASRYAGAVAGLCTGLLSVVVFTWFFDETPHVLDFRSDEVFRVLFFFSVSVLVASLERQRRNAIRSLEAANEKLRKTMQEVKILRGVLSVCTYCKHIETEAGGWAEMEEYVRKHSEAEFSHGVCPDCLRKLFPDIYERRYGPLKPENSGEASF